MKMGAGWNDVPGAAAEAPQQLGPGLPSHILPAAPQAAEASKVPATSASSHNSGDERRQLRAPEPAPLLEQGGLIRPPPTLIWTGLAPVLDGPLLMMASFLGARVVSVLLGSVPCEESKTRPVGACKVPVILFC